jgi:hypothetical protein
MDLLKALQDGEKHDFAIVFILQAFSYYMGPASNRCLERRFLKFFNNISYEDLKNMRWCDLIADFLIESIIEYKHKDVAGKKCWGNVLILLVSDVISSAWLLNNFTCNLIF